MPLLQAVIFDLDGTLLDTLEDLAGAGNAALAGLGFPQHPVEAYRRFVGDGTRTLAERILPEQHRGPGTVEACFQAVRAAYGKGWGEKTRPYPGVEEILKTLRHVGMPAAVLTNKPQVFADNAVNHFFEKSSFVNVIGARDGQPLKPDPAGALELAALMHVAPEHIALVGDSNVDVQTALAANMRALGAGWGFRGPEELRIAGAHAVLHTPQDVLPCLT